MKRNLKKKEEKKISLCIKYKWIDFPLEFHFHKELHDVVTEIKKKVCNFRTCKIKWPESY